MQLSQALDAQAIPNAVNAECDIAVLVKRVEDRTIRALRSRGAKLAWDIVDAYPQPAGNDWTEREAKDWLRRDVDRIKPDALIAATDQMRKDCKEFGLPVMWLRHHHRPGIRRNPIREKVTVVGYEGSPSYVAKSATAIRAECERIGASFVVNPDTLADCDIVLALRDARGYPARHWKSGVKLANAHGSGTPFIGCREAGYIETATGCEYWADNSAELRVALIWLADQSARELIHERFVQAAYPVERAAADLMAFLQTI